ncbi:alpha/beta fold hydrolase [Lentzea sp. BCCO 10_0856]|uniref:Alpha/beta fold hydrolase n=1 Tax=Lentzea miocenica TaxID=3095431 RepID=A0ABU4TGE3_9PSEU|nr:alpha/beta fold hydrolase [Lentzea sp. BCCO 10_0856]MDX8037120.1 alpha/beta fold hydrolase [Lentzea sp. BCCO 10_0856]
MTTSPRTGMVPVDDTALAFTDTGGPGRSVLYLNGSYASQRSWRPVIAELGTGWRHITYDERARGASKRSADYSFEACLRDVGAIVAASDVDRPLLVGWPYGAALAVHWAARNPDRVAGVVVVDGAMPWGLTGEANRERIRRIFGRMRFLLPLASPFGLAARMTAAQHAEVNIEINEICAALDPVLDRLTCPVSYVLATGANLGGGRGGDGGDAGHARSGASPQPAPAGQLQGAEQPHADPAQGLPGRRHRRA